MIKLVNDCAEHQFKLVAEGPTTAQNLCVCEIFGREEMRYPIYGELLEAAARELCKLQGIDPDKKYLNHPDLEPADGIKKLYTSAWEFAAIDVKKYVQIRAAVAAVAPTPSAETNNENHKWDANGERCLKCGDKDWGASTTCSGKRTTLADQCKDHPDSW